MILITGGAYHGKRNYAKQMYPGVDFVDGISCVEETIFACQGMDHFHSYIENRMREGKKLPELLKIVEKLKCENSEISSKALDIRGLLDSIALMEKGLEVHTALDMGITNKSFDMYEQTLIKDTIGARISKKIKTEDLFKK